MEVCKLDCFLFIVRCSEISEATPPPEMEISHLISIVNDQTDRTVLNLETILKN